MSKYDSFFPLLDSLCSTLHIYTIFVKNLLMIVNIFVMACTWNMLVQVLMYINKAFVISGSLWSALDASPLSLGNSGRRFIRAWCWSIHLRYGPRSFNRCFADGCSEKFRFCDSQFLYICSLIERPLCCMPFR